MADNTAINAASQNTSTPFFSANVSTTVPHVGDGSARRLAVRAARASRAFGLAGLLAISAFTVLIADDEDTGELAQYFGFKPLELYKLHNRSEGMVAGDLNNDGRSDLLLIDNSNSRLDLLEQREAPVVDATQKPGVNAIQSDWRLDHKKIAVDRAVSTLAVGDLNADGRKDIVHFSVPDQLNIRYQSATGDWGKRTRIRLPDVPTTRWTIAVGDLNGDQRDDIVVLGKNETYLLYQQADGEMSAPAAIMNTSDNIGLAQIADLDGDGRNDLVYLANEDPDRPLCARLQTAAGKLGPELRFELTKFRGVTMTNLDNVPGQEFVAIEATTGRVKVHQFQRPQLEPGELAGQLIQYGFGQQGAGRDRDLAVGDVNGDGLVDVVVTDPTAAQIIVFQQTAGAGLDQGTTFPGLVNATTVRIGDLDGDKQNEVVMLSGTEKAIAISRMQGGRLSFPQPVSLDKEPAAMDLTDLNGDGKQEIVFLAKDRGSSTTKFALQALSWTDGELKAFPFAGAQPVVSPKAPPERLVALDANHDGHMDFLILQGAERPPVFLLAKADGSVAEQTGERGIGLGSLASGGMFVGMLDKPSILVAQGNFARNVDVGSNGQWRVLDQYNAAGSEAKIVGAATLDLDLEAGREIVLVDQGAKKLRVLRREGTVYRPWREVDIGAFAYKGTQVADLNGDGREDLLLFGPGKFGVLYAGQSDPRLKTIATYESKLEKVYFADITAGDLNNDGRVDLAVLDTQSQVVEILDFSATTGLRHGLFFKVYEAKSLQSEERTGNDPREAVIADVTGDGLADLVLLTQDRVLVYPQDPGTDDAVTRK